MPAIRSCPYRRISLGVSGVKVNTVASGLDHLKHEFHAPQRRTKGVTHAWLPLVEDRICLGNLLAGDLRLVIILTQWHYFSLGPAVQLDFA